MNEFLEKWKKDHRFQTKIKLLLYTLFVIIVAIYAVSASNKMPNIQLDDKTISNEDSTSIIDIPNNYNYQIVVTIDNEQYTYSGENKLTETTNIFGLKTGYAITLGTGVSGTYSVELLSDATGAYLYFKNADVVNFVSAVRDNSGVQTYDISNTVSIRDDITQLGDVSPTDRAGDLSGTSLTVDGHNNVVSGLDSDNTTKLGGVTVVSGKTFNLRNATFKNFADAFINAGSLNIAKYLTP